MLSGDYAIGLLTIITGLAIADVVVSLHLLLLNRARVRWDWLAMLAAVLVVLLIMVIWGLSYQNLGNREVNPLLWQFGLRLAQIVPMYLAARAILPDEVGKEGVALADHYAGVSRYFWASIAVTYLIYLAFNLSQEGPGSLLGFYLAPAVQLMMMAVLIATPKRGVHVVLVPIIFAWFCYDHLAKPMFG